MTDDKRRPGQLFALDGTPYPATDGTPTLPSVESEPRAVPRTPSWLLRRRITIPDPAPRFHARPALAARCAPTARPLTLLIAPGGFGKTTLLAEVCRDCRAQGLPTAWLSLDGDDAPGALDTHLAFAFQEAGIDTPGGSDGDLPHPRTARLLHAVEALESPCVLALDDAERLTNPKSVALLNVLVRAAPPKLHLAIACRHLPDGLDIADRLLGDRGLALTADDLRFSAEDTAAFLGPRLPRRELDAAIAASAGWPIALGFLRYQKSRRDDAGADVARVVLHNWMSSSLWRSFSEPDLEFLLALGLFDWFDAALLADVFADPDAMTRLTHLNQLEGLLQPAPGEGTSAWRLHPLLLEHCANTLRRRDPERHARVQRRIARALAQRGRLDAAVRHAVDAGDPALAATVLLDAGGLRLCLSKGLDDLVAAVRTLPVDAGAHEPRLALAQSVAAAATGRLADARRLLAAVPWQDPELATGEALQLCSDHALARVLLAHYGCETTLSPDTHRMLSDALSLADSPDVDPLVRSAMEVALCVAMNLHAAFDDARERGVRAQRLAGDRSPFLTASLYLQHGQAAMAQGNVRDALAWYRRGRTHAKTNLLQEPRLTFATDALLRELALERNRIEPGATARMPGDIQDGTSLAAYLAAADVAVELTRARAGTGDAILLLEEARGHARRAELPALGRYLDAVRVSLLADTDSVDKMERTWQAAALPNTVAECISLFRQSWREVESVSLARIRLLDARGDREHARHLARALINASCDRRVRRTVMRTHGLCVALEHRAGERDAAFAHLTDFLALYTNTDYAWPLLREREAAVAVLQRYLDNEPAPAHRPGAETLLKAARQDGATPSLTEHERRVLARLETERDQDIAAALGLSRAGVRYHVGNLFAKLGVRGRRAAVRRAREFGELPARD